jgi:putative hydrolase of HD superfamily
MSLFHDISEARTNDAHRIVQRYVDWEGVDRKAVEDQSKSLPNKIAEGIRSMISEFEQALSLEARVARDADLLECLIQAREYQALGYHDVADWILNAQAALATESAKKIAAECLRTEPKEWWQGLKAPRGKGGVHGD